MPRAIPMSASAYDFGFRKRTTLFPRTTTSSLSPAFSFSLWRASRGTTIWFFDESVTAMLYILAKSKALLLALLQLQQLAEPLHFFRRQRAPAAGRQIEFQERNLHAPQLLHQPAEIFEHDPDLILAALRNAHLIPRIGAGLNQFQLG